MQASLYDAVTQVHELHNNVVCEDRCALEVLDKECVVETRNNIRVIQRHNASHTTGAPHAHNCVNPRHKDDDKNHILSFRYTPWVLLVVDGLVSRVGAVPLIKLVRLPALDDNHRM